jgi:hypothetical protein
MKKSQALATAAFALASLPLLAQAGSPQTGSAPTQAAPPEPTQSTPAPPEQAQPSQAPANPTETTAATASAQMSPVNGELVDKLDTKTAKTGDSIVVKTRSNAKTMDGTEIPKGSKLIGHVTAVKPSANGDNSQVALEFDRAELKGGQNLAIHSEIQSLSLSDSDAGPSGSPSAMAAAPGGPSASAATPGMNGSGGGPTATSPSQPSSPSSAGAPGVAPQGPPAAGTVVARTGNIAIRTTSIPGVLLASNEPGQQDPRMAQSSGILLGPKHDIHLDGGTRMVIGVAPAQGGAGSK